MSDDFWDGFGACKSCWTEASRRALIFGGSPAEHYRKVLAERTDKAWRERHAKFALPAGDTDNGGER